MKKPYLPRLLDFSQNDIARLYSEYNVGEFVSFNEKSKAWSLDNYYEINSIGAAKVDGKFSKEGIESAFVDFLIGNNYSYKAKIVDLIKDVGDGNPGMRVEISFPKNKITKQRVISILDII